MLTSTNHRAETRNCPLCERAVPAGAPEGLCLVCLLEAGFEGNASPAGMTEQAGADDPGSSHPRYFGDYEILREVGRGGMGVVYEARQFGTQRTVALKLLTAGAFAGADAVHRFHTEAQASARLEHPHIVPVYEAGMHDGQYFLAMRFLPGGSLAQLARGGPVDAGHAASIVLSLARATAYAHQHGVLHRDLKPGNVLLDENGQAHLADFGLARLAELEGITLTSAILGTAAYLPPEQACGGAGAATTAGDIYGLGTVLYELLTGQPPFTGSSVAEILRKVQEEEPAPPLSRKSEIRNPKLETQRSIPNEQSPLGRGTSRAGMLNAQSPIPSAGYARMAISDFGFRISDLQTICLKCLEKEPAKRYATAQDLAEDLEHFLNDEPILARPVTRIERLGRWCRRKPALATLLLLVLVLLLVLAIGSPIAAYRINEARQMVEQEARKARQNLYFAQVRLADQAVTGANPGHAARLLEQQTPSGEGEEDLRDWEWHYLWNQVKSDAAFALGRHESLIRSVALSPNSQLAASSDFAGGVSVWNLATRQRIASFKEPDMVHQVLFISDALLLVAGANGKLGFYDLSQERLLRSIDLTLPVRAIALSRDRSQMAALCGNEGIPAVTRIWRLQPSTLPDPAPQLALTHTIHSPDTGWWPYLGGAVVFSPSGDTLAVGDVDNIVRVYSSTTGELSTSMKPEGWNGAITTLAYSPDGRWLASHGAGGQISEEVIVWNVPSGERVSVLPHSRGVRDVAFTPDGASLLVAGADQVLQQWNTSDWSLLRKLFGHRGPVNTFALTGTGRVALSGGNDGMLLGWDLTQASQRIEPIVLKQCRALRFSASGKLLATVEPAVDQTNAYRASLRFAGDLSLRTELAALGDDVLDVAFSSDEKLLASFSPNSLRLWDLHYKRMARADELPASNLRLLIGFTKKSDQVLLMDRDLVVSIWDTRTGRVVDRWSLRVTDLPPAEFDKRNVAFHPDSGTLVIGLKGAAVAWDVNNRTLRGHLGGHSIWPVEPAITADGSMIATLGQDGDNQVLLWNADTLELVGKIDTPPHPIYAPAFTPNGRRIAVSLFRFGAAGVYDVATGFQLISLPPLEGNHARSIQWSPDGSTLVTQADDAAIWQLPSVAHKARQP
jgi:serine/threonine protein kinase/WD40 repeat protein